MNVQALSFSLRFLLLTLLAAPMVVLGQNPQPLGLIATNNGSGIYLVWQSAKGANPPFTYNVYRIPVQDTAFTANPEPFPTSMTIPERDPIKQGLTTTNYTDNVATSEDFIYWVTSVDSTGNESTAVHTNYSCSSTLPTTGSVPSVRPRVFVTMTGSNLGDANKDPSLIAADASTWGMAATCLDGIWNNISGVSTTDQKTLWGEVNTTHEIDEYDFNPSANNSPNGFRAASTFTDAVSGLTREAIAMYPADGKNADGKGTACSPSLWSEAKYSITSAVSTYLNTDQDPFNEIVYGCGSGNWYSPLNSANQANSDWSTLSSALLPTAAHDAFNTAGGSFLECIANLCDPPLSTSKLYSALLNAIVSAHMQGHNLIVDASFRPSDGTSGWLGYVKQFYQQLAAEPCNGSYYPDGYGVSTPQTYNLCTTNVSGYDNLNLSHGLWWPNDIITLTNYSGNYPATPAYVNGDTTTSADSVTGILTWLLRQ